VGGNLGVTGNTSLTGALTANSTATFNGATSVGGANTFTVGTGATSLGGTLNVTGQSTLGVLNAGASTLSSATITNAASVGGNLGVTGTTTLTGALTANSTATFNGATSVGGANTFTVGTGATTLGGTLNVSGTTTLGNTNIANNTTFSTGAGTGFFYGGATGSATGANTISSSGVFTGTLLALTADQTESGTILGISAEGLKTGKAIDVSLGNVYQGTSDGFGTIGAVNVRAKSFTGNIFNVSAEGLSSATGILANFKSNQVAGTVVNVLGNQLTGGTAVNVSATGLNTSGKAIAATVGASGTPIYVDTNPSGYSGNLIDLHANGSSRFSVNQAGALTGPTTAAFTIDNGGQAINIGGGTTATLSLGKTGQITNVLGDFQVATNKFTVAAASGDTVVAGTLQVKGASLTGSTTGALAIDNGGQAINIGGATTAALNLGKTGQITNVLGTLTVGTSSSTTGSIALKNSTNANTVTIQSGATTASYTLTLPTAQGGANTVLQNDGSGALSWATSTDTDTDTAFVSLFAKQYPPTIGGTTEPAGVTATNLGTTFKYLGSGALVRMDGYTTIRLLVDGLNTAAQTGTVTVDVFNVTNGTTLASLTFTSTTRATYEVTAAISITGVKNLSARAKSTVAADDPIFHSVSVMLEK
jgi:hypothetical protein